MLSDNIKEQIQLVEITVTIAQGYPQDGREKMQELIENHFALEERSAITVDEINLRIPDSTQELEQYLDATDREVRQIRDRLNDEQIKNQALTQEVRDKDSQITNLQEELNLARSQIGQELSFLQSLQKNPVWVAFASALFLAILIAAIL